VRQIRTYVVETSNALFTLVITNPINGNLYQASYSGVSPKSELPSIDDDGYNETLQASIDGELQDTNFDVLLEECRREIIEHGGEILGITDVSDDEDDER
jgi:hypothetical protein